MFSGFHAFRSSLAFLMAALLIEGPAFRMHAQSTETVSKSEIRDISVTGPQADSPFFIERQDAKLALAEAGRTGYGMYVPKPPRPPVGKQVKKFFTGMFASVKFGKNSDTMPMLLRVEPSEFSLSQTGELDVSLRISNPTKQEIELVYPNDQRLEVVTKDASGTVIGRWSEDRVFDPMLGFVEVNPEEYVLYAEKIPTSKMKAGQTYTIEASLAGQEGYSTSVTVTPKP